MVRTMYYKILPGVFSLLNRWAIIKISTKRQTRRKAGAQSLWASLREVAGLPKGGSLRGKHE